MSDQYLYVTVYEIDGIEHTLSGYADNAKEVERSFNQIKGSLGVKAPDQEMKLKRIHFRVSPEEKQKIIEESIAKNPEHVTTDPMLLHKPQSEVIDFE